MSSPSKTLRHRAARGFTLLEVLIALAIVAVSVGALLGTITSSASNVIYLRDKTLADWVALNRLTEIRISQQKPGKGRRTGNTEMGGMRWQWEEEVVELPVKGMFRIDIRARPTGEMVDDTRPRSNGDATTRHDFDEGKAAGSELDKLNWMTTVSGVIGSSTSIVKTPIAAPLVLEDLGVGERSIVRFRQAFRRGSPRQGAFRRRDHTVGRPAQKRGARDRLAAIDEALCRRHRSGERANDAVSGTFAFFDLALNGQTAVLVEDHQAQHHQRSSRRDEHHQKQPHEPPGSDAPPTPTRNRCNRLPASLAEAAARTAGADASRGMDRAGTRDSATGAGSRRRRSGTQAAA